ncbi:MAG TPA: ParA family protein [Gammaproteobacteria bacterium]|nr:ParA family protein [Gammaproteobacteria bacterium]
MNVWTVANQKGGVGKTTTAVSLGGHLVRDGRRVLLIDLDPHGSLSSYFGYDPDGVEASVYRLFTDDVPPPPAGLVAETGLEGLGIIPANTALATLDRQMGIRNSMGLVVARVLRQLESQYDYVIMDCPPMLGILMVNALAACQQLIIPVQTEYLALKGLERMSRTVAMMSKARRVSIPYTVVPTMFDRRTKEAFRSLDHLREAYRETAWSSVIPVDTKFREASRARLPISHACPSSRGALAYATLLNKLLHADSPSEPMVAVQ